MVIDVKHFVPLTLLAQACVSVALAALAVGFWQGVVAGMSALLGGIVAVVPNAISGRAAAEAEPRSRARAR